MMQRRNFKMPNKNFQRKHVGGNTPRQELKREFDHWVKGLRSNKQAPKEIIAQESRPQPQPDDEGRWQDDGGESG